MGFVVPAIETLSENEDTGCMIEGSSVRCGLKQTVGVEFGESIEPRFTTTKLSLVETVRRGCPLARRLQFEDLFS